MLGIKKYKHMGFPFSSWLYRIASNEVNMHFRAESKVVEVEILEKDVVHLLDEIEEADAQERQDLVIEALNELPLQQTELIEMRFFEKRSFKEIGSILGITEGNAKIKVYRALDKLKALVKK